MATYESDFQYASQSAAERRRLWDMEKKPELDRKFEDLKRDNNADLGQRVRNILRETPHDHLAVLRLCAEAEDTENRLASMLYEGVEAEGQRLTSDFVQIVLNHPGERDPNDQIREGIAREPTEAPYCSPVLMESLFWEGTEELPNTHRKRVELDFPARVEALLDFHCVAFHADVDVMKKLYDEDLLSDKTKTQEVLSYHRTQMETLMDTFAGEMKKCWTEENQRIRSRASQSPLSQSPAGHFPPSNSEAGGGRRRSVHMADSPTVLEPAGQRPRPAHSIPLRGILKKPVRGVPNQSPVSPFQETVAVDSLTFEDEIDEAGPFFLDEMIVEEAVRDLEPKTRHLGPEITATGNSRSRPAGTRSYEIFRPHATDNDMDEMTPRAASHHVADLTERFARMERGPGKSRFMPRS
ncbi:hypothetical protein DFH06DRAFT_653011 [Mycena polygramma]|nr:hypothetical protein DFH06DRAFT_653011 [Mycena polygramma]